MTTTRTSLRPPAERPDLADPGGWNEKGHEEQSRIAPRLGPPTNRAGLADPATKTRQTLRVLLMIIAALVVASFLVGIRW
ncbi:MAG: hypothetical protein AUI18_07995 [Candidatus Rokubacteria bacterium 13_1_40CM_2_70_45]|nr:MAG: hypothetical protein AUI18_07995 [Candidatus Rokubacteria bacterium 13_1_40CM_2_70_45]